MHSYLYIPVERVTALPTNGSSSANIRTSRGWSGKVSARHNGAHVSQSCAAVAIFLCQPTHVTPEYDAPAQCKYSIQCNQLPR